MFKTTKKKVVALAVGAAALATAGVGYAYWSGTGSGSGSAATGSAITATLTGTSVTGLYPGATAKTISGTVAVSNGATSVYVGTVTPSIAGTTVFNNAVGHPACSATDFLLTNQVIGAQVSDGATINFGTIQLKDTGLDQDNCKSQSLDLSFSSN